MNALKIIRSHRTLLRYCILWDFNVRRTSFILSASTMRVTICTSAAKNFSLDLDERLKYLSDVESYIERDFTLSDLQKKFDEENLPASITTSSLLNQCETIDDVLQELKNAILAGKLWKEEILLYFDALRRMKQEIAGFENLHDFLGNYQGNAVTKSNIQRLHDNPYFQYLIKEAVMHSSLFTTEQLAALFHGFAALKIPPECNTMLMLVAIIQNRINDFFPKDVLNCLLSIRLMKCEGVQYIDSLHKGLLLHLDNQTVDEPAFRHILKATSVANRMRLLALICFEISWELQHRIHNSVIETVQTRPRQELRNLQEAESILRCYVQFRGNGKFLLISVIRYFDESKHEVTDRYRDMFEKIKNKHTIENLKLPPHLESTDDSHH